MIATAVRRTTWTWVVLMLVVFVVFAATLGPPETPEGRGFERDLQLGLLVGVAIAVLVGVRWEAVGGALLVTIGIALGVASVVAFPPLFGLVVAAMFVLPGVIFLALWLAGHGPVVRAIVTAFVLLALGAGGFGAARVYAHYYGPAHPESLLVAPPPSPVTWIWTGALAPRSITVKAKVDGDASAVRLAVDRDPGFAAVRWVEPAAGSATDSGIAAFVVDALEPGTTYHYAVEVDGALERAREGRFTTPEEGAFSFTVALGSCARTGSNGAVYDTIREIAPLFFMVTGDFFYGNVESSDPAQFRQPLDRTLTATSQSALYRAVPIAWVWDDHDFGGNNSDSTSPGREAVQLVYRESVPHYPLDDPDGAIYQAFSVGRVRFILTDTRSDRIDGTLLGERQKEWLKRELLRAHETHALAVWVNTVPWIVDPSPGADDWGGYPEERAEIADFIAEHGLDRLVMVAGDAHMLAIDDGSHTDYSTSGGAGFPLLHAAALDRPGSIKGGPYSEGAHPGAGQFASMEIVDDGGPTVRMVWTGLNWELNEIVRYERTFTLD